MKNLLTIPFLLLTFFVKSQNLVPNGSFEFPASRTYSSIGWVYILNNCTTVTGAVPPDDWRIDSPDPDLMKSGTIYCLRDNDLAQDGQFYAVLNNNEGIEITLDSALRVGCLYQFSCFFNLEKMGGTRNNPSRVMFFFSDPDGGSIMSPIISFNVWQYFATPFTVTSPSTTLEAWNWVNDAGVSIDNIRVVLLDCPTLPVQWLYIRTKGYAIEWATASEINSDRFEIYDTQKLVTTVKASGNTSQPSYYKVNVKEGFYRIKQIDIDGKYSYSKIIHARGKEEYEYVGTKWNILGQELAR